MARTGRPRKPTALKKAQGTFRKDRALPDEMAPALGVPTCPAYLDSIARKEWARVTTELAALGMLTLIDGAMLEAYCANYSAAVRYQKRADKRLMVRSRFGKMEPNPAAAEARKHWALVKAIATEFGLSPSSRSKVSAPLPKKSDGDPVKDFLFRRDVKVIPGGAPAAPPAPPAAPTKDDTEEKK